MELHDEASLLRIFVSPTDKLKHAQLYEAIAFAAKRNRIAGATAIKGSYGIWFGQYNQYTLLGAYGEGPSSC